MRGTYKGRAVGVDGSGYVLVVDVGYDEGDVHVPVNASTYQAFASVKPGASVNVELLGDSDGPYCIVSLAECPPGCECPACNA